MKVVWIVVGAVVVVLVLPGILLGLANVVNTTFGIGERSVSGTVSYEGGELALPEGAVVDVVLLELPPESTPLRIVVVRKELDGEIALPLEFKLTYHEANIHEGSDYLVEVSVREGERLLYSGSLAVDGLEESVSGLDLVVATPGSGN